jgi:predicted aspartyl protease
VGVILVAVGPALASSVGAAASACTLARIEEWPVRFVHNFLVVDGAINGQPVGILLDTGSTRTLMLRSAAMRLNLPRQRVRNYRMFGVGGETPVETVRVDFSAGETVRKSWQLLVAGEQDLGGGIDVILGEDFFHAVDVEFDLARGVVRLFEARDCDGAPLSYWASEGASEVSIQAINAARPQILVPVQVNGRSIEALLDSGAPFSILTKRDAEIAGVTPGNPGVVAVGKGRGLGSRSIDTWIGPIDSFKIGDENIRDTAMLFGDLFKDATYTEVGSLVPRRVAGLQQMLLGIDFLRSHRVLIAHSQRKLYFSYVGGQVFRAPGRPAAPAAAGPERAVAPKDGGR